MNEQGEVFASDEELSSFIGYNLKRVINVVRMDLAQTLSDFDLRAVSFSALNVVTQSPGISQTQLAQSLVIERSNLVQIVDELSARKLIARTPFPGDRRRHALVPTAKGKALLEKARHAVAAHEARMFGMLTDDERDTLQRILVKIRASNEA